MVSALTEKDLADEYRGLGGRRLAVIDDNIGSSRDWPARRRERIASLPEGERRDVKTFLRSPSDENDELGSK